MLETGALRLANSFGRRLEKVGLVPDGVLADYLSEIALNLDEHQGAGELPLEPAIRRLTRACDDEAKLTTVGRFAARRQIVELLDNLVRTQAARRRNPEIEDVSIGEPVVITGLPRTGSTLLHSLRAQDPAVRVPATWEVMRPPISRRSNPDDIRYCEKRLQWVYRLAPSFRAIHPMGAHLPQECIAITAHVFRSIVFHTTQYVPSYQDWLEAADCEPAYRYHRRFLQYLQYFGGSGRWVLKAPGHMFGLRALLKINPGATIVQSHRDPVRVAASLASHTTVLRSAFSSAADAREVAADWLDRWWRALDHLLDVRASNTAVFADVYYSDLVQDPLRTIEDLYGGLGWRLTTRAKRQMRAFLSANPQHKHGRHRYTIEQVGLDRDLLLRRLHRYRSAFSIPDEPLPR